MSHDLPFRSGSITASADQPVRAARRKPEDMEAVEVYRELVGLDTALAVSSAELDAIELLLGSELKLFTS